MHKSGSSRLPLYLLATALVVSPPAFAQTMKMFDPTTSWALVKTPNANSPQQSYCTITQKYMGNVVVSYARNMADERSLALDFQSDKFEVGKQYSIQIKTAGAYEKAFSAKALKGGTFVLSLGKEDALEKDLGLNRTLEAIIEGNTYRFNAAEFDVSAPRLQKCVTEVAENIERSTTPLAEPPAEIAKVEEPVVAEKVAEVAEKEAALTSAPDAAKEPMPTPKVEEAKNEAPSAPPEQIAAEKPVEPLPSKIVEKEIVKEVSGHEAQEKVKMLEDQLRAAAMQRESIQKEKQGLLQKVASLEAQSKTLKANTASVSDRETQMKKISAENEMLKGQIASLNSKLKSLEADKLKLASAPAPACSAQPKMASAQPGPQIMAELQALETENDDLTKRLLDTDARLAQAMAARQNAPLVADNENAPLRKQVLALREELKDLQGENSRLRQISTGGMPAGSVALSDQNWNLEKATSRFQQAEREVKRLGLLVDEERQKCKAQKREIEHMLFDPAISNNAQMSMLNRLESKLAESNDRVVELETKLAAYDPSVTPSTQLAALDEPLLPMVGDEDDGNYQINEANAELMPAVPAPRVAMSRQVLKDKREARAEARKKQAPLNVHPTLAMLASQATAKTEVVDTESLAEGVQPISANSIEPAAGNQKLMARAAQPAPVREIMPPISTPETAKTKVRVEASTPVAAVPVILKEKAPAVAPTVTAQREIFPGFREAKDLSSILSQAKVQLSGQLQAASSTTNAGVLSYRWETDKIDGAIEQRAVGKGQDMDALIKQYVSRLERECTGDFAATPNGEKTAGGKTISTWDIACVKGDSGKTASIAFQFDNEVFTAFVQESTPEEMTVAMDTRDALTEVLTH